jgi:hypothetical protein
MVLVLGSTWRGGEGRGGRGFRREKRGEVVGRGEGKKVVVLGR